MGVTRFEIQAINLLLLAGALGLIIGFERQWRQRMAGLRTNALVATGAALFVLLARQAEGGDSSLRVTAQIVSGIGFLGAGVIMRDGLSVRGLNTAATLWCAAAVGATAAHGFPFLAIVGTFAVVGTNVCLRPLAQRIDRRGMDVTTPEPLVAVAEA